MYANFNRKAIELIKEAVQEDENGNYSEAIDKYSTGWEYIKIYLKYEKNQQTRDAIEAKCTQYFDRAEYLKKALNDGASTADAPTPEGSSQRLKRASKEEHEKREEEEKNRMQEALSCTTLTEKPDVKWDEVAGLEKAKESLKTAMIPLNFPQFFRRSRSCSGILLYGPSGSGKSYLAKALAAEADIMFFNVAASDLESKWIGKGEQQLSSLFEMARKNSPAIVFFDNVDSIWRQSIDHESEAAKKFRIRFLIEMQASRDAKDSQVLVLGATNLPHMLDRAVLKRFDKRIYIPLPEAPARGTMFKIHLRSTPNTLTDKDFEQLSEMTEGFSGLDISEVVKDALMEPLRCAEQATHFRQIPGEDGPDCIPCELTALAAMDMNLQYFEEHGLGDKVVSPPISKKDFEVVLARAKPTVGTGDLEVFERFTAEFGEED